MPRMFVQGTGGIAQPPQVEVAYAWTLPSGWKEVGTGRTGFFGTSTNFITIEPIDCSKPGNVTVYGTLVGAGPFCNSSEKSATATISINGANPVATVGPQAGYTGGSACNTTPVTFYATTSVALGCISGYNWSYPPSWSLVSQSGNSITLTPSGTTADSNPIKATITFTCGSSVTSGNYVPPFNNPVISGSFNVCTGGTNFTLTNAGANQVNWAPSSNMVVISGQGTATANIKAINSTTRGTGTISASLPGCPAVSVSPKTVWVGVPNQIADILKGSGAIAIGATVPFSIHDPNNMSTGSVTYDWDVSGGYFAWIDTYAWTTITEPYLVLYAGSRNVCGSLGMISRSWSAENGGCPPGEICEMSVFPNPSSDELTVSLSSTDNKNTTTNVKLADSNGTVVYSGTAAKNAKEIKIPVKDLKNGAYYLSITQGRKIKQQQIIIRH